MRFLGIGDSCDLGALYHRLVLAGHEVRVSIADPLCQGTLAGLVERTPDWEAELDWIREAGREGIVVFENVAKGRGEIQDGLRRRGFNVVGGSAFGDRLENDRAFAQGVLGDLGLKICPVFDFSRYDDACAFILDHLGRYVLKFNGPGHASNENFVGRALDGQDVRAMLMGHARRSETGADSFILMQHVEGVEMGVGAYFDGTDFMLPACLDWEHKRFFPGDLGELTGEMGTVATFERTGRFFDLTLGRLTPLLRQNGYHGYINLNTIVNEDGIWPLEFTCRFGYPGFAILDPLQETGWADLLAGMGTRSNVAFRARPGFSVGLVLTTPPFPYTRRQVSEAVGLPVLFQGALDEADRRNIHYGEVGLDGGELVTSGLYGWTMVVTGTGATIEAARDRVYERAGRITVPNLRYRTDIGQRLILGDYARVERLGLLDPA